METRKDFTKMRNRAVLRLTAEADKEFGRRLKKVLKQHKVTQNQLCSMIDFSVAMMSRWTTGNRTMRISTFAKIVDALNLTATEFAFLLEPYWEDNDG